MSLVVLRLDSHRSMSLMKETEDAYQRLGGTCGLPLFVIGPCLHFSARATSDRRLIRDVSRILPRTARDHYGAHVSYGGFWRVVHRLAVDDWPTFARCYPSEIFPVLGWPGVRVVQVFVLGVLEIDYREEAQSG